MSAGGAVLGVNVGRLIRVALFILVSSQTGAVT